jgi:protein-tyrosine phosphatase
LPHSVRSLTWDGCLNVRDLGGHHTENGAVTRFGRVVRADSVRHLSEDGWAALVEYGIRTVVDLRFHRELEADPPRTFDLDVVHVSLFGEPDDERWAQLDALAAAAGDAAEATRTVYLELLEEHQVKVAAAVAAVGTAPAGGVVVHCHAGKDRTGLVTALLLRLAGVSRADVAADYALSERNLAPLSEQWIAEAENDVERNRRRWISSTPAAAMLGVLGELERRHGSAGTYLRGGGATAEDVEATRARLLEA